MVFQLFYDSVREISRHFQSTSIEDGRTEHNRRIKRKIQALTDNSTHLSKADSDASPLHSRCRTGRRKLSASCLKSARLQSIAHRLKANYDRQIAFFPKSLECGFLPIQVHFDRRSHLKQKYIKKTAISRIIDSLN